MLTITAREAIGKAQKPADVVRGEASRLPWMWDGLCFAVPFNESTRDSARDIITNAAPSTVSGLVWTRDDRGNAAANLGTSSSIDYLDNPTHNRPSTALTAYIRLRRAGATEISGGLFAKRRQASPLEITWGIRHSDGQNNSLSSHLTVSGTVHEWESSYVLPTNAWVNVFLRWQSGKIPNYRVLGERGNTLNNTSGDNVVTGSLTYGTGEPIRLNAFSTNFNGDYSQAMVWNRRLNDDELIALVLDPFGWYAPRRETTVVAGAFPFVPGAGEARIAGMRGGL